MDRRVRKYPSRETVVEARPTKVNKSLDILSSARQQQTLIEPIYGLALYWELYYSLGGLNGKNNTTNHEKGQLEGRE